MNFLRQGFRKLSYYRLSWECMHLVTRGHFRSRDSGHTVGSVIPENLCIRKLHGAIFYRTDRSLHCGNRNVFFTFFAPVTLTLTRWSSCTNLICIPSRCTGCAEINFLRQDFLTDVHTDRRHEWNYIPRGFAGGLNIVFLRCLEGFLGRLTYVRRKTLINAAELSFFTALHGMQTRSSDENSVRCLSVRLSVCQTRALWQNG